MKIIHILKDGTTLNDISGHVVQYEDCPELYEILIKIMDKKKSKKGGATDVR